MNGTLGCALILQEMGLQKVICNALREKYSCYLCIFAIRSRPVQFDDVVTLFIPTLEATIKFVIMIIGLSRNFTSRGDGLSVIMQEHCM